MAMQHDPPLVVLSIIVAIVASYTAFNLAERLRHARNRNERQGPWLVAGAAAMGSGIWSMHFVAMLAMEVPFPVAYDPYLVALSAIVAAVGSAIALSFVTRDRLSIVSLLFGGLFMGAAIAGMHYIGMAALRAPAAVSYVTSLVLASLAVAAVVSWVAMALLYRLRDEDDPGALRGRLVSSPFMGLAVAGMHYTAMAAVRFGPVGSAPFDPGGLLIQGPSLAMLVTATSLTILIAALVSSRIERHAQKQVRGAQAESQRTQRLYQDLVELAPVGILELAGDVISYANPAASSLLRVRAGGLVGRSIREFGADGEGGGQVLRIASASTESGPAGQMDLRGADGTNVPVELLRIPAADGDGRRTRILLRDLSAQRAAEEERRRSAARFRSLTENAAELIVVYSPEGRVLYETPSVERVLGYAPGELERPDPFDLVHADDAEPVRRMLSAVLEGNASSRSALVRVRHRDGSWRFLDMILTNLVHDSTIGGIVCNGHDVTARLDLESQLQHSQRLEIVGGMAAAVAHDINNVVTSIEAIARLLEDELPGVSAATADLDEIRQQCRRATSLTRQLLTFSRSQVLELSLVDVARTVGAMENVFRSVLGEAIRLDLDVEKPAGCIRIDPNELEQVLMNLLINARDATEAGGRVRVRVDREPPGPGADAQSAFVRLEVEDDGRGIPPEIRERIFQPFFTTKGPGQGTGLGLATVDRIVTRSGGRIEVESEEGRGTLVRLLLPVVEESATPARDSAGAAASVTDGKESIMLVEDDESVRNSLTRILTRSGYRVTTAKDGLEALELARDLGPGLQLVLSDVVMPRLSGPKLAQELRSLHPQLPILLMSGYNEEESLQPITADPVVKFLQKPVTPLILLRTVRELLDRSAPPGEVLSAPASPPSGLR